VVQARAALRFLSRYSCSSNWGNNADLGGCKVV
jgi:hypothetical protein